MIDENEKKEFIETIKMGMLAIGQLHFAIEDINENYDEEKAKSLLKHIQETNISVGKLLGKMHVILSGKSELECAKEMIEFKNEIISKMEEEINNDNK